MKCKNVFYNFVENIPLTQKNLLHILLPVLNQSAIFVGSVVGFLNVYKIRIVASFLPPQYHL